MHILLTNDDGINSDGLYKLYEVLGKEFKITVCAPEAEQSAIGHAITLSRPLHIKKIFKSNDFLGYAVSGTPADCVKIAVRSILKKRPDMVISGINHGPNLGSDVMYSGTVSAATEGAILGIPSIAVSLTTYKNHDFRFAAKYIAGLAKKVYKFGLADGILLNVNIPGLPKNKIKGVMITRQARSMYKEKFVIRKDPRGRAYYWLTGRARWFKKPEDSDIKAIEKGYVSITPLQFDLTAYGYIDKLKEMVI
ncbi:MAG: 5'/3'-nucleotidase SurE [Candidatus Omnitrophica bacterium]|nr:5'/3'-nucleotidase SurE [Candidatus Omnitrophota bacterium]